MGITNYIDHAWVKKQGIFVGGLLAVLFSAHVYAIAEEAVAVAVGETPDTSIAVNTPSSDAGQNLASPVDQGASALSETVIQETSELESASGLSAPASEEEVHAVKNVLLASQDISAVDLSDTSITVDLSQGAGEVDLGEYSVQKADMQSEEAHQEIVADQKVALLPVINVNNEYVSTDTVTRQVADNKSALPEIAAISDITGEDAGGLPYAVVLAILALISLVPVARRD